MEKCQEFMTFRDFSSLGKQYPKLGIEILKAFQQFFGSSFVG